MPFYYFPVKGSTISDPKEAKTPALPGDWRLHSTDDEAQLAAWEAKGYRLALDCEKSGVWVVDIDEENPDEAAKAYPSTYAVRTPRGGLHLYYLGQGPTSTRRLGRATDTRGVGGYVVAYDEVVQDVPLAGAPQHLRETLAKTRDRKAGSEDLDLAVNIARARDFLRATRPAVEGEGGDERTLQTAYKVRDLGISQDKCLELMLEDWNERCDPPWLEEDLAVKVENAYTYAQNEAGAWAVDTDVARFAAVPGAGRGADPIGVRRRHRLWSVNEALSRPPPRWLLNNLLPREAVTLVYGPQEVGKTWLVLDQALHIASGVAGYGEPERAAEDVVYYAGEGFNDLAHNRVTAWCEAHNFDREDLRFHFDEDAVNFADEGDMDSFVQAIRDKSLRPALIVFDTYARQMAEAGLNENDPLDVMTWVRQAEVLKRGFGCTIMAIHHAGKDLDRKARGSNSLIAAVDAAYEVTANWDVAAFKWRTEKMKMAEKPDPLHFEAQKSGKGLVFRGILPETYRSLTTPDDEFDVKKVGGILKREGPLTTEQLAASLHALIASPDQPAGLVSPRLARKLRWLAKERLAPFYDGDNVWKVPD